MRLLGIGTFLLLAILRLGAAERTLEPAPALTPPPGVDTTIDPERGVVLGLPFGASEADAIARFGKPTGRIEFAPGRFALAYGPHYLFLFHDGEFDAVRVGDALVSERSNLWLATHPQFLAANWRMPNGLRPAIALLDAAAQLRLPAPDPLADGPIELRASGPATRLTLHFTDYLPDGTPASAPRGPDAENPGPILIRDFLRPNFAPTAGPPEFLPSPPPGTISFSRLDVSPLRELSPLLQSLLLARVHADGSDHWRARLSENFPVSHTATQTNFRKIGLSLQSTSRGLHPVYVIARSPAARAGIQPGDLITAIEGRSTLHMSPQQFAYLVRQNDLVNLAVTPASGAPPRAITLETVAGDSLPAHTMTRDGLAHLLDVQPGQIAPDLDLTNADNQPVKLSALRGRPVLLLFMRNPTGLNKHFDPLQTLRDLHAKYQDRVEFVSVYIDSFGVGLPNLLRDYRWPARDDKPAWRGAAARAYGLKSLPTVLLLDPDGKILRTDLDFYHLEPELEKTFSPPAPVQNPI